MRILSQLLIAVTVALLATCSGSSNGVVPTPQQEDCQTAGDEDGNGLADCADPACADTAACRPRCGNGKLESGEFCDDGNLIDGDGCDHNCTLTACGNGVASASEACDDGNATNDDGCNRDCTVSLRAYIKASQPGANDSFGGSLALSADGSTLAISAVGEDGASVGINGDQSNNLAQISGAVYVFVHVGAKWIQQAYIKASNTSLAYEFGFSIALSADGSALAVGSTGESSLAIGIGGNQTDKSASNAGAVYVFTRSGTNWSQQAYVKASNTGSDDRFGVSVALSGNGATLAVGAGGEDSAATGIGGNQNDNTAPGAGAAYVFTRSSAVWTQQAYIKASNPGVSDLFGERVALSADGSTLAVAAIQEGSAAIGIDGNQANNSAQNSGAVYVFINSGTTWSQQAYVKASNTQGNAKFGTGLALSADGSTLAVGALGESSAATGVGGDQSNNSSSAAGAVYVFTRSGTTWSQDAYVKASNTGTLDFFGQRVGLSADGMMLAVGAPGESSAATRIMGDQADNSAPAAGAVYMFARSSTAWSQRAYVKAFNTDTMDAFGAGLALSADGSTLAVGAPGEASAAAGLGDHQIDNSAVNAGAVYVLPLPLR